MNNKDFILLKVDMYHTHVTAAIQPTAKQCASYPTATEGSTLEGAETVEVEA